MAFNFNGNTPTKIVYNSNNVYMLIYNGVVVWTAVKYIYQNGVLASGVTLSNLSNTNKTLYVGISDEPDDEEDHSTNLTVYVNNIDCTDYQYVDITLEHRAYVDYGSAYIKYGVGSANIMLNDDEGTKTSTVTLDVSSYTGMQNICFYLYTKNRSSEPTWGASAHIKITEIKLRYGSNQTSTHTHTSACYHTHTDACYVEEYYGECGDCGATYGSSVIGDECSKCGGTILESGGRRLTCTIAEGTKTCGY